MRRRIANIFAAVLGVISLALVVLGVRSFWVLDEFNRCDVDAAALTVYVSVGVSEDGYLRFGYTRTLPNDMQSIPAWKPYGRGALSDRGWHMGGGPLLNFPDTGWRDAVAPRIIHKSWPVSPGSANQWRVQIPYWIPVLVTGTWPVLRFTRPVLRCRRETRRRRRNQCINCGYDLRAHEPGEKCPECGRQIAANMAPG